VTAIVAWVKGTTREGFLVVDGGLSSGPDTRIDKTRLIYGRWAVAAYGSSLVLSVVDDLCYFNDKAIRPPLVDMSSLIDRIDEMSAVITPHRLDWLSRSAMPAELRNELIETGAGLVVLDCETHELAVASVEHARDLSSRGMLSLTRLRPDVLWHVGHPMQSRPPVAAHDYACSIESALTLLRRLSILHPQSVGAVGASVSVDGGQIRYQGVWTSLAEFARDRAASQPYYFSE
jgi:hypothetical protein